MDELYPEGEPGEARSGDGTRLHYITVGEGLPLVFCNGVLCTYTFFHFCKDYFKDRCRMLFWDYRGHARSETPDDLESINIVDHARDLAAVMDAAGMEEAVLLGHSMGVMVLLEFYRLFPERVKALVLLDGPYRNAFSLFCRSDQFHLFVHRLLGFLSHHPCLAGWSRPVMALPIDLPLAKLVDVNPRRCPKRETDFYLRNISIWISRPP
ncbi:MAG: alpha/beta hydrolase [Actinomycetota bacterium]|nr:alpha/beta hydrolase [Actinomycetota bacterium]